jgi:dTDP-4-dehydrorhamnose reductase
MDGKSAAVADSTAREAAVNILLIGANGQLGQDLARTGAALGHAVVGMTHADLEVTDAASIERAFDAVDADVVINTAAYHRVDEMEDQPSRAFEVNATGVRLLALACAKRDWRLAHVSTDYVFSGVLGRPHIESDRTDPRNVYGISKRAGESLLECTLAAHWVFRTSGLYGVAGASGKGGNFVQTMLRLGREGRPIRVVDDQVLTPTYTVDLATTILDVVTGAPFGLYHATSAGQCSWYEFAAAIFELAGLSPQLARQSTEASGARARRPTYSVLQNARLNELGIDRLRHWRDALAAYLCAIGVVR